MGPYAISPIIVSLMDQPVQMVEVFTFPKKRSVQLSQTSVPRRYLLSHHLLNSMAKLVRYYIGTAKLGEKLNWVGI